MIPLATQAPNVTDWLQAIGTVGALLLTGGGLLYELRRRRLDQHEAERAAARAVLVTLIPDDNRGPYFRQVRVMLANYGRDPIVDIVLGVSPRDPTDEWFARMLPSLGPGEQREWTWQLQTEYPRPDKVTASVMADFGTQVVFEIAGVVAPGPTGAGEGDLPRAEPDRTDPGAGTELALPVRC